MNRSPIIAELRRIAVVVVIAAAVIVTVSWIVSFF